MNENQRTFMITEGAGFIGSAAVRELIRNTPHHAINVDKPTYAGNLESLSDVDLEPRYPFVQAGICDSAKMHALLVEHEPDIIMLPTMSMLYVGTIRHWALLGPFLMMQLQSCRVKIRLHHTGVR